MTAQINQTPAPKIPDLPLRKPAVTKEDKIDHQMEDTFPASDPPSYSGGNHAVGAPVNRESGAATADDHDVVKAEKKVKDGAVAPDKY